MAANLLMMDHAVDAGLLLVQLCAGPADLLARPIQPPCQQLHLLLQLLHLPLSRSPTLTFLLQLLGLGLCRIEGADTKGSPEWKSLKHL